MEPHRDQREVFTQKVRAGRRTYIFDVRATRGNDYFITITERKRSEDGGYHKQKLFLYKEDFYKFLHVLQDVIDHVRYDLLPDYDFAADQADDASDHGTNSVDEDKEFGADWR